MVKVLQFKNREDAVEVKNGMDTDNLELYRNKVADQYVVYPETEDEEGVLETFAMLGSDELEVSEVDDDLLVPEEDF